MGATLAAVLIVSAAAGGVTAPMGYTSPEERYQQSVRHTVEKHHATRAAYRVTRDESYREAVKQARGTDVGPKSPKYIPRPKATSTNRQATDTSPKMTAGSDADMAWVMGVLEQYGLDTKGSSWSVEASGRCGPAAAGRWAGCTRMTSPASVRINPNVIGTDYGVHVVVHEWVHAVEGERNECATEARAHSITHRPDLFGYRC